MSLYKTTPIIVIPAFTTDCKMPDHFLRDFCGKPLLQRTFDAAVQTGFLIGINIRWIYLVTDDAEITKKYSDYINTLVIEDGKGTTERAIHMAMEAAAKDNHEFDCVMVLDPNYPLRSAYKLSEILKKYDDQYEMILTVSPSKHSPYLDMFQKSRKGMLARCKKLPENTANSPAIWVSNPIAALYNPEKLREMPISQFSEILPIYTEEYHDFNLDTPLGWKIAELIARDTNPFIERKSDSQYEWPL